MHILVSLADSCSSLVQASHGDIHISTSSESTGCQWGHLPKGAASRSASALAGWPLAHHLPKTRHPAQDGGPLISFKVWSPRSHSNSGPSPWQIPHLWLYFHTLTAQPPLTGCENTTKDTERKHREGSRVTTEKHGTLTSYRRELLPHECVHAAGAAQRHYSRSERGATVDEEAKKQQASWHFCQEKHGRKAI